MTIIYQAGDALLHTTRMTLVGDLWEEHVYIDEAPTTITSLANLWIVVRLLSDVAAGHRGDRDNRQLLLRVTCVSESNKDVAWSGAARVYALLHESGVQDRGSAALGVHAEWDFLTVTGGRFSHLLPNKDYGTRFYEAGYEFSVMMEAKNGYT